MQVTWPVLLTAAAPLDAAAEFHQRYLPHLRSLLVPGARPSPYVTEEIDSLVLVLGPVAHEHRSWLQAAVQSLAREAAPKRVNAVAGPGPSPIDDALAYLAGAPGVTGQVLVVDGKPGKRGYLGRT